MSSENDTPASGDLDALLNEHFAGKIVRKDLTKKVKEGANVPTSCAPPADRILHAVEESGASAHPRRSEGPLRPAAMKRQPDRSTLLVSFHRAPRHVSSSARSEGEAGAGKMQLWTASTVIIAPSSRSEVALAAPTTAGMPNSRATRAA